MVRLLDPQSEMRVYDPCCGSGGMLNARAEMYGGSTVLGLLVTSEHPAKACVTAEVVKVLEAAGAKRD